MHTNTHTCTHISFYPANDEAGQSHLEASTCQWINKVVIRKENSATCWCPTPVNSDYYSELRDTPEPAKALCEELAHTSAAGKCGEVFHLGHPCNHVCCSAFIWNEAYGACVLLLWRSVHVSSVCTRRGPTVHPGAHLALLGGFWSLSSWPGGFSWCSARGRFEWVRVCVCGESLPWPTSHQNRAVGGRWTGHRCCQRATGATRLRERAKYAQSTKLTNFMIISIQ